MGSFLSVASPNRNVDSPNRILVFILSGIILIGFSFALKLQALELGQMIRRSKLEDFNNITPNLQLRPFSESCS